MRREMFSISEKIRLLREKRGITQAELARIVGISRSGVNAWEIGLSVPSTRYVAELAQIFSVSTDYLFGIEKTATVDVSGLSEKQVAIIADLIDALRDKTADIVDNK